MRKGLWTSALLAAGVAASAPVASRAAVFVNISIAPPAIPIYEQPVAPGPDYIWTPGYWQWDPAAGDYFWVPGTWVLAPQPGYLWTPGYWAFDGGFYGWHAGYWGPHIGFYGGVNYGFGYFGHGYEGGYWNGGHFFYNTAYSRVNVTNVRNVYVRNVTVVNNVHTSYVGGNGLQARPTMGEQAALRENHMQPTGGQLQNVNFARQNRTQFASMNHGAPPAAALPRPAQSPNAFHQQAIAGRAAVNYAGPAQQRGFTGAPQGQSPSHGQFDNRGAGFNQPQDRAAQTPGNRNGYGNNAPQGYRGEGQTGGYQQQTARPQTQGYPGQPQEGRPNTPQAGQYQRVPERQAAPEMRQQARPEPGRPASGGHEHAEHEGRPR